VRARQRMSDSVHGLSESDTFVAWFTAGAVHEFRERTKPAWKVKNLQDAESASA